MRFLAVPLVAAALLVTAGSSFAAGTPSVTLSPSTFKVLYGHPVTLAGRISTGRAGHRVLVFSQSYGAPRWRQVAAVTTGAGGRWSYKATPSIGTDYQARLDGGKWSPPVAVGVTPLVTVHELGGGGIWTQVSAGHSFNGRFVKLQRRGSSGWATLDQRRLDTHSRAIFRALTSTAQIRVAMSVNQAGAGYLGTISHVVVYRAHSLSIGVSTYRVPYGNSLLLAGRLGSGRAGQTITVRAWPYGSSAPQRAARVTTQAGGRWSFRAKPAIQTTYVASWGAVDSRRITIGVEPLVTVRQLANGSIWTRVYAVSSLRGRDVQLQRRLPGGVWQTIAKHALSSSSTAVFAPKLPTSTIRVAISVNQAGAGLLGSFSRAFAYHAT